MERPQLTMQGPKVWLRHPHRNNNSLGLTIPAAIRRTLNWHMNAPFVIELIGDHMEVRQLDMIKAAGVNTETKAMKHRKKSWRSPPLEERRKPGGFVVESPPVATEDN